MTVQTSNLSESLPGCRVIRVLGVGIVALSIGAFAHAASVDGYIAPKAMYFDSIRTSQYVSVRDGSRLAIDIYRPQENGKAVDKPFPVILVASLLSTRDRHLFGSLDPYLLEVLKRGYVIALLETRGHGASFGQMSPVRIEIPDDYWDLYDVIEWLAAQPWSDGKIGMAGYSNAGLTQFRAASTMPPHLKAIMPASAPLDWATLGSVNGVTANAFSEWREAGTGSATVDEDPDGSQKEAALMQHRVGGKERFTRPFRDQPLRRPGYAVMPTQWWNFLSNFKQSQIPVFQFAGWRDIFSDQSFALYRNLAREGISQKLIIGPWYHGEWYRSELGGATDETIRWYDYFLKGVQNGAMDEPPIRYYVVGAPPQKQWKSAKVWPLPNAKPRTYFLGDAGALLTHQSASNASEDQYVVKYISTTPKLAIRWTNGNIGRSDPGLLPVPTSDLDASSLTYTTPPLKADTEVTGFPVITLWITSSAKDQDFFVNLEEVDADGRSTMLTDGALRASNRATREPPFDNEGLPWHGGYARDQQDLVSGVPTKLQWALFPLSNYIKQGHRLRISINSFDKGTWDSPEIEPAPTVTILHDKAHPSSILLPFM
jgi:uncharacterized protein